MEGGNFNELSVDWVRRLCAYVFFRLMVVLVPFVTSLYCCFWVVGSLHFTAERHSLCSEPGFSQSLERHAPADPRISS